MVARFDTEAAGPAAASDAAPAQGAAPLAWRSERGIGLIIALLATMLLTALGLALVALTNTETAITSNYRDAQEALYAADAGVERAMQDLLLEPDWNNVLQGNRQSGFFDGLSTVTLGDGTPMSVEAARALLQQQTDTANVWGANDPQWQWYGRGFVSDILPEGGITSRAYVMVFVGDDPSDNDGDPTRDANGVISMRVEAYGPQGGRKVVETTVSRTSSAEIERGYIAQRGQEELNQRARKAAVQTPGRGLTEMRMNVQNGTLAVQ